MRVLVTGAAGYVGYAVGRRLIAAGHEVTGLVRRADRPLPPGVRPVIGDLLDPNGLDSTLHETYDGVCHLAARTRVRESFDEPLAFFTTNVQGTINLLEALTKVQPDGSPAPAPAVVYGSTAAVYGNPDRQPIPEAEVPSPTSPYGAAKLAAEQLIRFHARTGAIGAIVLRTFNVAGSVDGRRDPDETRLIPKALAVAAGHAPHLTINGDGAAVREYLHVDDLAAAYVLALEAARPGTERVYNVGSGTGASVKEVIEAVEEVTGRRVPTRHNPPQPEPPLLVADATAIRRDLGWQPERSALPVIIADSWAALSSEAG
ncbi:NAD-dependent epimerase/dehydratase family protein [Actinomadura rudentiformis]|uniref:UDP-glucose 4-epimerase n=1 Tax=Actinomadura rudentiformis TaxID=359158 RepID=A0A6H9YQH7_9ACTN|nr:NAD-dependent epimerase/dehydratase family protein [Actinomadura rudentiformis]KAB2345153.1 UDP-glucose 4-epimerase [Actinomadura rudentiformis]